MIVKSYPFMGKRVTTLADLPVPFPGAFLGREKLLDEVGRQLSAKVATMLYGAEGVGKTTLAAAALRAQRASHAVWINAGFSDLGALCDQVGQAYEDRDILDAPDPEAHRARTRSRLDEAQPLLVIDDVANPQAVRAFMREIAADLPVLALADEQLSGPWAPLAVGGLSRPAATALFYHHSRLEPGADADNVDRVCALLEDHPLSLEVVARLVAVDQVSPGELLAALPSAVVAGGSTGARRASPGVRAPRAGRADVSARVGRDVCQRRHAGGSGRRR
ncbi:MAG: hypothetical protein M5R40_10050 [Anaerolineae bacterium]|nr:hypothetical protein [Anaerolineae bacterium]